MSAAVGKTLLIASPHGFCAGVRRAVSAVEELLEKQRGKPLYVYNEIVHNKLVVKELTERGAVFVKSVEAIPEGEKAVFSAHGVSKAVEEAAKRRRLKIVDATCPLVTGLHRRAVLLAEEGNAVILIGKAAHPETVGTLGQLPETTRKTVVENVEQAEALGKIEGKFAILAQTTLNGETVDAVVGAIARHNPGAVPVNGRCYATENRQNAVRLTAERCEVMLIIGSAHSSNSQELRMVAENSGAKAILLDDPDELDAGMLEKVRSAGLSAGASAPPEVFERTVAKLRKLGFTRVEQVVCADENIAFPPPDGM